MPVSFVYLASRHDQDVQAGVAGFIAAAVLIGSGLVSMAILATGPRVPGGRDSADLPLRLPPDDQWKVRGPQ
jgi:hypothetical protein